MDCNILFCLFLVGAVSFRFIVVMVLNLFLGLGSAFGCVFVCGSLSLSFALLG